jgi:regulator of protease activity HflC (stomatin/prohibitin superfamily)
MPIESILALFVAACALIVAAGLRRVPDGIGLTVHRFGRYVRTLPPGLHFVWPLLERIGRRVNLIGHQVDMPRITGTHCAATVYFQILDPARAGEQIERVDAMVELEARSRLRSMADDLEQGADLRLKMDLNARFSDLGLRVTRCQLRAVA